MAKKAGQKRKKEEKSKTQLKKSRTGPGQHLPKGTNVTRAEVKVGKIVIPKQVQDPDIIKKDTPVTRRNLSLEDLLGKLTHFSQSVKTEALEGLKELLTGEFGGNLVNDKLSLIVSKILPLCSDQERKVRRACLDILQAVLSQVDSLRLEPLYPLLTAHLSCCLTSIQPSIQRDALPLIDTLVVTAPHFIKSNFHRILPDCLRQISASSSDVSKTKDGGRSASLSNQVTDKISSLEWRTGVLRRVDQILECLCDEKTPTHSQNGQVKQIKFRGDVVHTSLCLHGQGTNYLTKQNLVKKISQDPLVDFLDRIMPLVLDSWVEAQGKDERKNQSRSGFLQNDVLELFCCICGILEKLVRYAGIHENSDILNTMRTKYYQDFKSRLFCDMPYSSHQGRCDTDNLKLCSVILSLADECLDSSLFNKIENIIKSSKVEGNDEELAVYEKILFNNHIPIITLDNKKLIAQQLVERSLRHDVGSSHWSRWQDVLARLAQLEGDLVNTWISRLPALLMETKGSQERLMILKIMLILAQKKNRFILQAYTETQQKLQDWSRELSSDDECGHMLSFVHRNIVPAPPVPS